MLCLYLVYLLLIFCQIGEVTGRIVHLKAGTDNVELQGRQVETQSVIVEDGSGKIRLQL